MTVDEFRDFIAAHDWKFAGSMPNTPHEYTLRERCRDRPEFDRVVQFIRDHGYEGRFFKQRYMYLDVDGWKYWTMGAPLDETLLINRARIRTHDGSKP